MALIKCPECNKEISDKAKQCIFCGYPLSNTLANPLEVKEKTTVKDEVIKQIHITDSKEGKGRPKKAKILLPILLIVLVVMVFVGMYPKVIVPSLQYKQAETYYAKGEYEAAVSIYEQLGGYKESEQRLQKIEGIINPVVTSIYSDENFVYALYSNDTIEINSYVGDESEVHIPAIIDGAIVRIGDKAFYNCDSLKKLTISDGVTSIGEKAFAYCDNLQSVAVPNSVEYIGNNAFRETGVKAVTLSGCAVVGDEAFYNCDSLETLIIADGVTSIGEKAFAYSDVVQSVDIPSSVTSIGNGAFYETGVNAVVLNGCGAVGDAAFYNCDSLRTLTITDGVISIGEKAFAYSDSLESFDFPSSVTAIGNGAFKETDIKSVTIKNGVVGDEAFYNCDSLEKLIIEDGVTSIGKKAFSYCDNLNSISIESTGMHIDETVFDGCDNLRNIPF